LGENPFQRTTKSPRKSRQLRSLPHRRKQQDWEKELTINLFEDHSLGLLDEVIFVIFKV
jgi:hypothetical protein